MNDNDIIKALECCMLNKECEECPLCSTSREPCRVVLARVALDVINRQKAEIEAIKLINSTYEVETKRVRDIAIKEFAESVKKNRRAILYAIYDRTEYSNIVDNLAKEMTEGEDGSN